MNGRNLFRVAVFVLAVFVGIGIGLLILASAGADGPQVTVFLSPIGPPEGAIQLLSDTMFEDQDGSWEHHGDSEVSLYGPGNLVLHQGGVDAWGLVKQEFSLADVQPGSDIWIKADWQIMTAHPINPLELGYDVSDGWISREDGGSVAWLWSRYDYEETDGWESPTIRVTGLTEVCTLCTFLIASMTNSTVSSRTDFIYDNIEIYGMPRVPIPTPTPTPYPIYLPLLWRE